VTALGLPRKLPEITARGLAWNFEKVRAHDCH
jgi:hypothetical protein